MDNDRARLIVIHVQTGTRCGTTGLMLVMMSEDSGIPPVVFSEKNEHRNHQYTKIHKGYNYAATVVYHISSLKVPLFVKPADN